MYTLVMTRFMGISGKIWGLLALSMLISGGVASWSYLYVPEEIPTAIPLSEMARQNREPLVSATTTHEIRGYTIKIIENAKDGFPYNTYVEILKKGKRVFDMKGDEPVMMLWPMADESKGKRIGATEDPDFLKEQVYDITGNDVPELMFVGYTGGAHCCDMNYIIELTDPLRILWRLYTGDGSAVLVDLNKDGINEIKVTDDVLDYWNTGHALSPFPTVIFSLKNGSYKVDTKLMRVSAPSEPEIRAAAKKCTGDYWSGTYRDNDDIACVPPWGYAADLIYSGNVESAKKFIDLAWTNNATFKSKDAFIHEFMEQLEQGRYYDKLESFLELQNLLK